MVKLIDSWEVMKVPDAKPVSIMTASAMQLVTKNMPLMIISRGVIHCDQFEIKVGKEAQLEHE